MAWPDTSLVVETALALGADLSADPSTYSYTDITSKTFDRDGNFSIVISRGRADETTVAQPSQTRCSVNNTDGRFLDHYPLGPYYGQLRRNTPLRIRVNPGTGLDTRSVVYTYEMPPRWQVGEVDYHVPIKAAGILRRLQQGRSPARSALARAVIASAPDGYWPMEDQPDATVAASALPDVAALTVRGTVDFAAVDGPPGSGPLCSGLFADQGSLLVPDVVAGIQTGAAFQISFVFRAGLTQGSTGLVATWTDPTDTTYRYWSILVDSIEGTNVMVSAGATAAGALDSTIAGSDPDTATFGEFHHVVYRQEAGGTRTLYVDGVSYAAVVNTTSGPPRAMLITPYRPDLMTPQGDISIGHFAIRGDATTDVPSQYTAMGGYVGELAGDRFARLCAEDGIPADVAAGSNQTMGAQGVADLLTLLRECEQAEAGLIVERRTGELGFDPHSVRENQAVALTLPYTSASPPLSLTDDDRLTRNDVTVTRAGGSSARVVDQTGPLGVDTVGRYDEGLPVSLSTDEQALHHAGWRVNLGTADILRFPTVTVNLRRNPSLVADWLALDIGSRIKLTNLPDRISYDDIDLIVEGYTEAISQKNWIITFNCAPYDPYKIFTLAETTSDADEFVGRLAGDRPAAIRAAIDSDDTSVSFDPNAFRWTAVTDDFDPDLQVRLGGELVEVSSIATTAATFVAAEAVSSADNAAVTPAMYAGATTGDLILVMARIRSASAGTIDISAGYTRLPIAGLTSASPLQLFAKVHDGSEADPTVTPTGGAAGDTVSAFTFGFRNMPTTLSDLADIVVTSAAQTNTSAQDIAYPELNPIHQENGCVVLALGGKDDDWTSVAALSGFTEAKDASTTTGNDQGLVLDYVIQTTPVAITAGSFTVTGGASAVSEGALVALAGGYQTLTVSARSVNGVVKSHTVGTEIEVEDAFVLGL